MEERKRTKKNRWSHLDDFQKTASGEFVYMGATYHFQGEAAARRRGVLCWGLLAVGMTVCTGLGGFILAPGTTRCPYILVPYVLGFLAACSVLWGFCRLAAGRDPLRGYVYDATVKQFPLRVILTAVGAGGALVGEICYVALNGSQGLVTGMAIFLASQGAALAMALLWRPLGRGMQWERRERSQ